MGYIGSGPTRFNTADELTVTGDAEFDGNLTVKGTHITLDSATVQTVDLGDNDKIRLGDSDDLQIYHDGSNSFINDVGTGNLRIGADTNVSITNSTNSTNYAVFNDASAVKLYYGGVKKFETTATGVDVTGTVTADGLTVDGTGGQITTDNNGFITSKQSLDAATAGGRFIGKSNRGELGQIAIEQTATGADGGYIRFSISPSGSTSPAERLRIDASGNVGIGTSSPSAKLDIRPSNDATNTFRIYRGVDSGYQLDYLNISQYTGDSIFNSVSSGGANNEFIFQQNGAEAMRLDSSGNLLVGTTPAGKFQISGASGIANADIGHVNGTASGYGYVIFRYNDTIIGRIDQNGTTGVSYVTSSDYRLKTAVTYDWDATTRLKQLRPARFEWIADGDDAVPVDGFLAHEVQDIVPEAISGTKDAMMDEEYEVSAATGDIYTPAVEATYDEDGVELTAAVDEVIHSADVEQPEELAEGQQWRETTAAVMGTRSVPDYQGIDQSKLVPLLVKTIQELEARIAALETA
jgi:hypothetical protein